MPVIPVITPAQATAWDQLAESSGRPLRTLMECAGRAVAQLVLERVGPQAAQGVLVACGAGHNGGDGWVAARLLHRLGLPVWVVESEPARAVLTQAVRADALADGVRTVATDGPWPTIGVVIDAVLGTGAHGAPRAPVDHLLHRIADLQHPIIAVDGPSGLDLETGVSYDALPARLTVTFGAPRRGHLLARDEVGDLVVVEIGLPAPDPSWPTLVQRGWAASRLAQLPSRSHKGTRGRVVIVGGSEGMTGAARLAARAAFGAGAGLVHVVAPIGAATRLRTAEPDLQVLEHAFEAPLDHALIALLHSADVVVIGPGLGRAAERRDFVLAVLGESARAVIDADALVALRDALPELSALAARKPLVLTPHLGEFRALFPGCSHSLETDPWGAAESAAAVVPGIVLLKGVPTVIAQHGQSTRTVAAGNPGLATGGSGDVLSGILGTMMAQLDHPLDAAAVAAQALGDAADHAARRTTARAMRPMDVIAALPDVWRWWGRDASTPHAPVLLELPAPRRE
ncbi:MAG: NAD(P)H-hydrate dehydratase [Gemmatimonadetes bacterium]|nr:NAD(P)H-hydrate dehydratase [Gemmatimonadota bacterium]